MMKVVVADDEEKICQLILHLVDWKTMDMEVVQVVHNGIDAVAAVEEYHPHIVITDIRMPGYNGLEMISKVKELQPDTEFIIISGYSHFEYAQNAIRYGVSDYLLKPIKKTELLKTLERMRMSYLQKTEQLTKAQELFLSQQTKSDKIRTGLFQEVIFQKRKNKEELAIEAVNDEFHYHFQKGRFQVIAIKIDGFWQKQSAAFTYVEEKVLALAKESLMPVCFDMESVFEDYVCYTLLNYPEGENNIRKQLKNLLEDILQQQEILGSMVVTIGVGESVRELYGTTESFRTALWAVEQRIVEGTGKIIDGLRMSSNELAASSLFYDFNRMFTQEVERLNIEGVRKTIAFLKKSMQERPETTGHEVLQMAKESLNLFLFVMYHNQIQVKNREQLFRDFNREVNQYGSMREVFYFLEKNILNAMEKIVNDKKIEGQKPIREAKQYMQEHYMEPVTLEIVSELAGFNATYFSSLFKKEMGVSFLEYLQEIRMNKAKELLKETSLSVAAICEQVGYSDVKNFTKLFTRSVGLKPAAYRKLYA